MKKTNKSADEQINEFMGNRKEVNNILNKIKKEKAIMDINSQTQRFWKALVMFLMSVLSLDLLYAWLMKLIWNRVLCVLWELPVMTYWQMYFVMVFVSLLGYHIISYKAISKSN